MAPGIHTAISDPAETHGIQDLMAAARGKKAARSTKKQSKRSHSSPAAKGQHGGAREGAGRPRDALPQAVIDRLGEPPKDPTELRTWNARLLAEVQWLAIKGEIGSELAATLRANAGAIDRALPTEPPRRGGDDDDDFDDDDDDDENEGPELTEDTPGESLKIG